MNRIVFSYKKEKFQDGVNGKIGNDRDCEKN